MWPCEHREFDVSFVRDTSYSNCETIFNVREEHLIMRVTSSPGKD